MFHLFKRRKIHTSAINKDLIRCNSNFYLFPRQTWVSALCGVAKSSGNKISPNHPASIIFLYVLCTSDIYIYDMNSADRLPIRINQTSHWPVGISSTYRRVVLIRNENRNNMYRRAFRNYPLAQHWAQSAPFSQDLRRCNSLFTTGKMVNS